MADKHHYAAKVVWTGDQGTGTSSYKAYSRDHKILMEGKADIAGSADPAFRGDQEKHNPEDLLVAALSACHMLWYLHLCADNGVVVLSYEDTSVGVMELNKNGSGQFKEVVLNPDIQISPDSDIEIAKELHYRANEMCFIANSCNFPISHHPTIRK